MKGVAKTVVLNTSSEPYSEIMRTSLAPDTSGNPEIIFSDPADMRQNDGCLSENSFPNGGLSFPTLNLAKKCSLWISMYLRHVETTIGAEED